MKVTKVRGESLFRHLGIQEIYGVTGWLMFLLLPPLRVKERVKNESTTRKCTTHTN